jgi:peptidoglycan/LPS O-acetylase OafA/YrhL
MINMDKKSARMDFLDSLRGLAILSVILQHVFESLYSEFRYLSYQYFNIGRFGVTLFFLISGFIIPYSLERGGSIRNFWIGRFFRLYPVYWISLLLSFLAFTLINKNIYTEAFQNNIIKN